MQEDSPLYLNRDYAYWQRIASNYGIAAVLSKWGNPKSQSRNPKIGRTLQDALDTVEAFRPRLNHRDVVAVFQLYEDAEARDIRNTPITPLSGTHIQSLESKNLKSKKQESKKLRSKKSESKKVKFYEVVEEWPPQPEPQGSPNDSPVVGMSTKGRPPNGSPGNGFSENGSPSEHSLQYRVTQPRERIDYDSILIQLYPTGASAGDGSAQVFPLRNFLHRAVRYTPTIRTKDLSFSAFKRSWPDTQAASDHPLRWDIHTEAFTYSLRQTANIVVIRHDDEFVEAVELLRAELSGETEDNLITFYLRPKLVHRTWQAVPWEDGAAEILVHDAGGALLPVISFRRILREDLKEASPNKVNIMGVHALSLDWLLAEVYDRLYLKYSERPIDDEVHLECVADGSTKPIALENDYVLHRTIRLLQAQRALRQDEDAPLIFRVKQVSTPGVSTPEIPKPAVSTPTLPMPETFATVPNELAPQDFLFEGSRPESFSTTDEFDPDFYKLSDSLQPPQTITPPKTPLPKRSKNIHEPFDAEIDPSTAGVSASGLSSRLINDEEDNVRGDAGAFTISLDLVDRSVQQSAPDLSVQMKEILIRRFHCSPKPLLYLPFPAVVNKENHRLSETLVLDELFNDKKFPGIASLKLVKTSRKRHEYTVSKAGSDYPYCGRGPISSEKLNSSAIDSCLVAARLLDVGRVAADTLGETIHGWKRTLDDFHQQCIQAIDEPWEIYTYDTSIRRRDDFYNDAIAVYNEIVNGDALDESMTTGDVLVAARMWEAITSMASQFAFTTCRRTACALCFEMPVVSERLGRSEKQVVVNLDKLRLEAGAAPFMGDLLTTYFGQSNNDVPTGHECSLWESPGQIVSQRLRLVTGRLPPRLVVRPPTEYPNVRGATSDRITFRYSNFAVQEVEVKAHRISYRWLGGIYKRKGKRRVYWVDGDYSTSNRDVKFYDGERLCACIVGGFKPDQAESRVPAYWAEGTELLFYERLNKDNKELVLGEMEDCVAKLRGKKNMGVVSTITSFFSSPRQNEKRPRGEDDEDEMDIDAPSSKKPKLGSPFVPIEQPRNIDKMGYDY
ncbi:hypothetical protein MMC17_006703 [Xylographa soralifera]|nr:hypothetical protein [Xylographa soralifera]